MNKNSLKNQLQKSALKVKETTKEGKEKINQVRQSST